MTDLEHLEALLILGQKYGATKIRSRLWWVEFPARAAAPAEPEPVPVSPAPSPGPSLHEISPGRATDDADVCACGHSIEIEHGPGGCLVDGNCTVDVCFGGEKKP